MDSTRGARIAFERIDLPVGSLHKIKGNLTGKFDGGYKALDPIEGSLMSDGLKYNGRSPTGGEIGAIGSMGSQPAALSYGVGANLPAHERLLSHPVSFGIEIYRGKSLFDGRVVERPGGEA